MPSFPVVAIELTEAEREQLESWSRRGATAQSLAQRSKLVLLVADGLRPGEIAERLGVHRNTVTKWRSLPRPSTIPNSTRTMARGMCLNLGHLAFDAGEHAQARELLEESREMAERQHQLRCVGWTMLTLAELAVSDGAIERACALLNSALERLGGLGDRWGLTRALELRETALRAR